MSDQTPSNLPGAMIKYSARPAIALDPITQLVTHNGKRCRLVFRADKISVGCTDVTPEALRKILGEYDRLFGCREEVVQEGE